MLQLGNGAAQWLERRTRGRKVAGSSPGGKTAGAAGELFFVVVVVLQGQLSVLTLMFCSLFCIIVVY